MNAFAKRILFSLCLLSLGFAVSARAQDVAISYPQAGQAVRGEITVRFSGIPDGGYAVVKIDGDFITATSQNTYLLNTFPPVFPGDGTHKISITGINAGGKAVGTSEVSFEVANARVTTEAGTSTLLSHYTNADRLDPNVQRYRVFAQSDASIEGGGSGGAAGASGGGGGGMSGDEGGGEEWIPAPLDWQVSALMRREVRDIDMFSDDKKDGVSSANIRTIVQTGFQRQRESEGGKGQGVEGKGGASASGGTKHSSRRKKKASAPSKAPWKKDWEVAPEEGQYFVKMIEPSGREINATRKAPTIALADLLPTFPTTEVSPGSTWETRMTFLGELSAREPVNVSAPITFTSFETIQTPGGFSQKAAKLESRFQLPDDLAKKIAVNLILQGGSGGGGAGGSGGAGDAAATGAGDAGSGASAGATAKTNTASTLDPQDLQDYLDSITTIRTSMSRVLWFDVDHHRVLRSQDQMNTYFEYTALEGDAGGAGGGPGGGGESGGQAAEAEPSKISYNMTVTTWYDDSVPPVSDKYTGGSGTAHGSFPGTRDKYKAGNPDIAKINKPNQPRNP